MSRPTHTERTSALALEEARLRHALDAERRRRRAEAEAARWALAVMAAALEKLREPHYEPVDDRDVPDDVREAECRDYQLHAYAAEIEAVRAEGGDVGAFIEEQNCQALREQLDGLRPDYGGCRRPCRNQPVTRAELLELIDGIKQRGIITLQGIARELNAQEIPTSRGGKWYATTIRKILGAWR